MIVETAHVHAFATAADFGSWLAQFHSTEREIWLKLQKKSSGIASVSWAEAVVEALAWGCIDGVKKTNDASSWYQRFTPRQPKSSWSNRNREHAERLIDNNRMQPPGLSHVEAARRDGRWARAYSGSADMVMPASFLDALNKNPKATASYAKMGRTSQFVLYYRLRTAKNAKTRNQRETAMIVQLARREIT